jgi:hypothetical protein
LEITPNKGLTAGGTALEFHEIPWALIFESPPHTLLHGPILNSGPRNCKRKKTIKIINSHIIYN